LLVASVANPVGARDAQALEAVEGGDPVDDVSHGVVSVRLIDVKRLEHGGRKRSCVNGRQVEGHAFRESPPEVLNVPKQAVGALFGGVVRDLQSRDCLHHLLVPVWADGQRRRQAVFTLGDDARHAGQKFRGEASPVGRGSGRDEVSVHIHGYIRAIGYKASRRVGEAVSELCRQKQYKSYETVRRNKTRELKKFNFFWKVFGYGFQR
jgi:hypothetical protein